MSRWLKSVVLALVGLAALVAGVIVMLARFTKLPGEEKTPAGTPRDTALYIKMRDGVEIAADVWLPQDYRTGQRLPTLLRTTRYGRDGQFGWAYRLAVALKQANPHGPGDAQTDYLNQRHFVVVVGDARGSGASGGHRETEFSREEIADLGELVNWAAKQQWSNGRLGTFGGSYEGATAELTTVTNPPALKAVAPFSSQFDVGMLALPGGVYDQAVMASWTDLIRKLDVNDDVCADKAAERSPLLVGGTVPAGCKARGRRFRWKGAYSNTSSAAQPVSNRAAITSRISGRPVAFGRRILHHLWGDKRVRASGPDRIVTGSHASVVWLAGLRCL